MKRIVFLSLFTLCLPWTLVAQSIDDDLYYVPSKKKREVSQEKKVSAPAEEIVMASDAAYSSRGNTTVVVRDRKGNRRDVDEYNRRYTSRNNDFTMKNDTLYVQEKRRPSLDGEWVGGRFDGSEDDYEYAARIIRFRNPRYAIHISSPMYWDVVYGLNSWEWNVYTDGMYAYAFPTFSNRLWWNWRYNSRGWWGGYPYYGWGWNDWYGPGWNLGFAWGGWYGGWWGYHHPYYSYYYNYYDGWYYGGGYWEGGRRDVYTDRRYSGVRENSMVRRSYDSRSSARSDDWRTAPRESTTTRRVIGTRSSDDRSGMSDRWDASSSRRSTYTRPSNSRSSVGTSNDEYMRTGNSRGYSTRSSDVGYSVRGSSTRSNGSTYNRGSSVESTRSYSNDNNSRSYSNERTYSNSTRSSSSFSSGSSTRSGGGYSVGGGSTRSGGGGGSTRSR